MFERSVLPNISTSTAWWIKRSELTTAAYINLKSKLSTINFQQEEVPVAFFEYDMDGTEYIAIPKISRKLLDFIIGRRLMFQELETNSDVIVTYNKPKFDPLPHQEPILRDAERIWRDDTLKDKRVCISIPPGGGKSFCAAYLCYKMKSKFIFIVYSSKLVKQAYGDFCGFLGSKGMCILERGSDFDELDFRKIKGLFLTHSMLRTLIKNYSLEYVVNKLQDVMKANILIIDEFDRETGSCYMLDTFTNFECNLRLTGTAYRSLKEDDQVFQTIYRHSHMLGNDVLLEKKKELHLVHWKFTPSPKEYTKMQLYDEKLFKTYYNDYLANKDMLLDFIMNYFYRKEDSLIKRMLKEKGQVIIYSGRIENCQTVKAKLIKNFGIPEDKIGVYNSDVSDREKAEAETKEFIITTMSSLGRGYDNKNIRVLIYLEFSFSLSELEQTISRVGRTGGTYGYVIQGLDHSFWKVEANWDKKVRNGLIEKHFTKVTNYTIPDKWSDFYIYGYRKTSPMGQELIKEKRNAVKKMKWSKKI